MINLNEFDRRPDFSRICESIPCPACGAFALHKCRNMDADPFSLRGQQERNDYHQMRKIRGIETWLERGREFPESRESA